MEKSFVFVGNRRFVLERMIAEGVRLSTVIAIEGTHLEVDLERGNVSGVSDYVKVQTRHELLSLLEKCSFDVLVSNGCPFILPVNDLPDARYVNIHPSCLPDLRGVDPVIGSILFCRDAGATCHVMDTGIDTGDIVSSIRIPYTDDLDVTTLYQLSFIAEQQAFSQALAKNFEPRQKQQDDPNAIYYSRKASDRIISFQEENDLILQKIKAFNNRSQGCIISVAGDQYRVFSAQRMYNSFLRQVLESYPDCVVGMSYEDSVVFRKDGEILRFKEIVPVNGKGIPVGANLLKP